MTIVSILSGHVAYPDCLLEARERLVEQSKTVQSLAGVQRVLCENGWSDTFKDRDCRRFALIVGLHGRDIAHREVTPR